MATLQANIQYFQYPSLLTPPILRAAYSDRTAWLMAEMSRLAYIKFETSPENMGLLSASLNTAGFQLVSTFNGTRVSGILNTATPGDAVF
jgi:hypothetical protein